MLNLQYLEVTYLSDSAVDEVVEFWEADKSSSSSLGCGLDGETAEGAVGCLKESCAEWDLGA